MARRLSHGAEVVLLAVMLVWAAILTMLIIEWWPIR